ncbi:MAG: hypothetical protein HYT37_03435, partial [Candidatus Sungbacteria bacterium]|nr:hypothetical protein [Candidatus Sungbacteria bacterium]
KYNSQRSWSGWQSTGAPNSSFGTSGPSSVSTSWGTYQVKGLNPITVEVCGASYSQASYYAQSSYYSQSSYSPPPPECRDGIDNADTEDTLSDFPSDPGCSSPNDNDERNQCNDGIDNDNDGYCDISTSFCSGNLEPGDVGCLNIQDNDERNACVDDIDNDGDGLIDYGNSPTNDPGCISPQDNNEINSAVWKEVPL